MNIPEAYLEKVKWAIYEWLGTISVKELALNRKLAGRIEQLCKSLRVATA